MKVLVLGSNGATGFNVVTQLLKHGINVKAITRNLEKFDPLKNTKQLEIIHAGILELDNKKLEQYLVDVDAVISCLGHNISFKGIFGKPRRLVADVLTRTVEAAQAIAGKKTIRIILMNYCFAFPSSFEYDPSKRLRSTLPLMPVTAPVEL